MHLDASQVTVMLPVRDLARARAFYEEALALPTDRIRIPTERELFLFGKVASSPTGGAAAEVARQDFSTSYGYVME